MNPLIFIQEYELMKIYELTKIINCKQNSPPGHKVLQIDKM